MKKLLHILFAACLCCTSLAHADAGTDKLIADGQWQQVADHLFQQAIDSGYSKTAVARSLAAAGREEQAVALIKQCCFPSALVAVAQDASTLNTAQRLAILDQVDRNDARKPQPLTLAEAYLQYGRADQALAIYNAHLQLTDNADAAWVAKSVINTDHPEMMSSLAPRLAQAAQQLVNDVEAARTLVWLAVIQSRLGRTAQAEATLQHAWQRVDKQQRSSIALEWVQAALTMDRPDLAEKYNENDDREWRTWALYKVRKGDYKGAIETGMQMAQQTQWVEEYVHIAAMQHARNSPDLPALASLIETLKDEKPSSYVQDLQDLALVHAALGEPAKARTRLLRAAEALEAENGTPNMYVLQLTVRQAKIARQLQLDDIARPAIQSLPELLKIIPADHYERALAFTGISQLQASPADQAQFRESLGQAYTALQALSAQLSGKTDLRRREDYASLLLALAGTAQSMADANPTPG